MKSMSSKPAARKSGRGGWVFLAAVMAIYAVTALFNTELAEDAIAFFMQLLGKVLPVLVLVFVLIFSVDLLLNPKRVEKYLGQSSGIMGWLTAIVAGILSTGPVYAWYAVLQDLRRKGMRTSLAAAMLYSRAVKLPLLPLLAHYFGVVYTVVLVFYLIGFSIISGLLMERVAGACPVPDKDQSGGS
jgi:uncharacterized membrane protein YraQ (UPF0718 family)